MGTEYAAPHGTFDANPQLDIPEPNNGLKRISGASMSLEKDPLEQQLKVQLSKTQQSDLEELNDVLIAIANSSYGIRRKLVILKKVVEHFSIGSPDFVL